jgi:hypothetical protein
LELDQANAQIVEKEAQQRRLQDELTAAEARFKRQASAASPPAQDSNNLPAQGSDSIECYAGPSVGDVCIGGDGYFYIRTKRGWCRGNRVGVSVENSTPYCTFFFESPP